MSALGIGLSDLFGRRVMLASSAITAATAMQIFSALATTAFALVTVSTFDGPSFVWGCLSGLGMAGGISFYYLGLEHSTSTLVAPIVAAQSALLPYLYAISRGSPSSTVAVAGAFVAVLGLVLVTGGAVSLLRLRAGIVYGLVSGLSYAAASIFFIEAADTEGWWPPVGQRLTGTVALLLAATLLGRRRFPPPGQRINGAMIGLLTAGVSLSLLVALAANAAVGAVALSTFPVFSVLIGRVFFADAVQRLQVVGIALVVSGIGAVAIG